MKPRYEIYPPKPDAQDHSFEEFQENLAILAIQKGVLYEDTLQLIRDLLVSAEPEGITYPMLGQIIGTGCHPGAFWGFLSWLLECGVLLLSDTITERTTYFAGPYGIVLREGFRIYGVDVDRWDLIEQGGNFDE